MNKENKKIIEELKRKHNEKTSLEALAIEQFELQQKILKIEQIAEWNRGDLGIIEITTLEHPTNDLEVSCGTKIITKLEPITSNVRKKQNSRGIRLINIVKILLKANALKHSRNEVLSILLKCYRIFNQLANLYQLIRVLIH